MSIQCTNNKEFESETDQLYRTVRSCGPVDNKNQIKHHLFQLLLRNANLCKPKQAER
jgi:hypothetical protein